MSPLQETADQPRARLPSPEGYGERLEAWRRQARRLRCKSVRRVLLEFFGRPLDPASFHLLAIHHVAIYAGDFRDEAQWDSWLRFLHSSEHLTELRWGPSYIAPREYATPGYWINGRLDGEEIELFTCRDSGDWSRLSASEKVRRMSHLALRSSAAESVEPTLHYLKCEPGQELLAFAPTDALGHCYGHLRRHDGAVLEIVHVESQGSNKEV